MDTKALYAIVERWNGTEKGYTRLTFEEAKADMDALIAEVRAAEKLRHRIAELESHALKRNNDMQAFASEVARLANEKYSDYMNKPAV
jgi:hypothetical protein